MADSKVRTFVHIKLHLNVPMCTTETLLQKDNDIRRLYEEKLKIIADMSDAFVADEYALNVSC